MADYISREAAIQALCEAVHRKEKVKEPPCRNQIVSCLWTGTTTSAYAERILSIPAADVRPVVRGRWEVKSQKIIGYSIDFYKCSVCGNEPDDKYNFCPNCGADMTQSAEGGGE